MRIEAIFGAILALFVLGLALYVAVPGMFSANGAPSAPDYSDPQVTLCGCFDGGTDLALKRVSVLSSEYRTGYELCRAQLGPEGGEYWTAGWNAVNGAKPWEASCRAYERRDG